MQRAVVFLAVVGAVVTMGWLDQRREASSLRSELSTALSALSADIDSIERVGSTMDLGPGGVSAAWVTCPRGYRFVYGSYDSVSPDNAKVFFADTFGSTRRWAVGLDNSANLHTGNMGHVAVTAACAPTDRAPSAQAERESRRRVREAVAAREARYR